jgi:hypothetical protein
MRDIWQLYKGALTDEQCNKIIEIGDKQEKQDAGIFANSEGDEKVRRTQISWIRDPFILEMQIQMLLDLLLI